MGNKFLKDRLNQIGLQKILFQAQRSNIRNKISVKTNSYNKSFFFDFDLYELLQ